MYKAYASYFASFLLTNLKAEEIERVILFGSAAKDQTNKESDIDIFIELKKENKKTEEEINKILEEFYKSREALLFKSKGIDNKINLILGKIEDWKDLKESIESTGIILFGKSFSFKADGKKYALISWNNIKSNRGAFLNKIYGFNVKGKKYTGLIEIFNGKKIGKSSIMIPIEHRDDIIKLIKHYKVNAKIIEVYA